LVIFGMKILGPVAALVWLCLQPSLDLLLAQPSPVRIPRVSRAPRLSDFLDHVPREAELTITDFTQYMPGDGTPVSQPTTAYLSYDDKNLYVAYVCKDDPKLIRARLAKRDQIDSDDRVVLNIDTYHDHRRQYWFDFNGLGVQADGTTIDGVEDNADWDTVWFADGKMTEDGYVVLATIPFRSLRFPNAASQTWGLILGRFIQRNNEFSSWPKTSRSRRGWVAQAGDMEGLENISPGRNLQFIPYGLFSASHYLDQPAWAAPQFLSRYEKRVGLNSKVVLRDTFTLDLALNPDFSQVESDEPQVTVNQRYEVFFPEKRPFFLDNAGLFKTPQQLFFSRRIADPEFGARLTGRVGGWSLGMLAMDDRAPGQSVAEDDPLRGRRTGDVVFRLERQMFRDSSIGALVTSQNFGDTSNRVFALDTSLKVSRNWTVNGQAMTSDTRTTGGPRLAGPAYYADLRHSGQHLIFTTSYTDRNPGFRSQLGFINRVDVRYTQQTLGYMWRPERSWLVSFGPQAQAFINYDRQGRLQDWSVRPEFDLVFKGQTQLSFSRTDAFELFNGRGFRKRSSEVDFSTALLKWLAIDSSFSKGTSVNYYPAAGLAPFLGSSKGGSLGLTIHPSQRIRLDETYIYSGLATPASSVYSNHIVRSKVNYQFTRALSLRAILDYDAVLPNASLVNLERDKRLGMDVLFTYMLNYGTALYVGYTDLYNNVALDPTVSPNLRRTAFPDTSTGRQFFVKLSYLFRL